jgi:hypothetical protein
MSSPDSLQVQTAVRTWFRHIDHLARAIGARGSTTAGEARAAAYVREEFQRAGLEPLVEPFQSAASAWRPFALAMGLALVAVAVYPLGGRATAAPTVALMVVLVGSAFREVNLLDNPLRLLLPKRVSRNVWAAVPAAGEPKHRVAVIGHLDSHRTPLLFSSLGWQRAMHVLVPLGFLAMVVLIALLGAGLFVQTRTLYVTSLIAAVMLIPILLLALQADLTPYTSGANDNATGAGLLPTLAEMLRSQPLPQTEVWLVATGCEEVGCYGAIAFFRGHRAALRDAAVVVLDTVGGPGSGPCYLRSEGMVLAHHYDPGLLSLADAIAGERPELGAYSRRMSEAYTEGLPAIQAGLRALTLCGFTPDGELPHWHQPSDTADNIDREVLGRNYAFIEELLRRIDAGEAQPG